MTDDENQISGKPASGSNKANKSNGRDGDPARNAQKWSGGSKGAKGPITQADKANENSSAKS